jgi:hypothetical protein
MPSPVSARRVGEWVLRVISLALLVVILMRAWEPLSQSGHTEDAGQGSVAASLPRWSVAGPARLHLALDSVLPRDQRDWLAAIGRTGTNVTWNSARIAPLALTVTRLVDPSGGYELLASVPRDSMTVVRDVVGVMDSVKGGRYGISVEAPGTPGRAGISVGGSNAWANSPDTVILKRLLVEGAASWETKFTVAALAERGWKVDVVTHVAPGVDVREGSPALPDTSRYAAVIAVDSTAALVSRGANAFVRSGGGLITLHDAARVGPSGATSVVLEQRPSGGEVEASRVGAGRVIRVGYKDLWRQRMSGDDTVSDPVAAHRAWLARAVASVAYAPRVAVGADAGSDPAPLADMVDRLGARSGPPDAVSPLQSEAPSSVLFGILLVSLLLELASRRLRGAR